MGRKSKRLHTLTDKAEQKSGSTGKRYRAGIYARLSVNREEKNESIDVQVEIAKRFIEEWNEHHSDKIEAVDCYKDLGKTGTSFERDEFKRLMQDVRLGDINCVIVKDLSRFGRNYLEAGNYIEKIFPFLGVRFIAVADGYDTGEDGSNTHQMATEVKNLINDMYAKDFSGKARLSLAQRREEGSYVGGPPPYGYKAVREGKIRKLVPDENTAEIVRTIFSRFLETESYKAVADELNQKRINPPSVYRKSGEVYCSPDMPYKGWDKAYMEVLLKNETYIGRLVQGQTYISPEKERRRTDEKDWKIREQAHEPLIENDIFEQARKVRQEIRERNKNTAADRKIDEDVFEDILFCGVCGRKMTRHSHIRAYADGSKKRVEEYLCVNATNTKTNLCPSPNYIAKNRLTETLLSLLETEFALCLKRKREYERKGKDILEGKKRELESAQRLLRSRKEAAACQDSAAYMEYRMGKISQEELAERRYQREEQLQELSAQETEIRETIQGMEKTEKAFLSAVRALIKLKNKRVFTKELAESLIDKIYLYPDKRIEVVFTFEDVFQSVQRFSKPARG